MRRASLFATLPVSVFLAVAGCASVFGIPSDVDDRLLVDGSTAPPSTSQPSNEAGSSTVSEGGTSDAPVSPAKCDPGTPFGAPAKVTALNSDGPDGEARLTDDELTVYFSSRRNGRPNFDLYVATRDRRTDPFKTPILLQDGRADVESEEWPSPIVGPDGKVSKLIFTSEKGFQSADITGVDLKRTGFLTVNGALPFLPTPFVRSDRPNELWLGSSSDAEITKELADIFVATSADGTTFNAKLVDEVNDKGLNEFAPVISKDGLSLYISRVRIPDANGMRWFDILMARRGFRDDPFKDPVVLPPLRTSETETEDTYVNWISPDDCRIYFHRAVSRDGTQDIWMAERPLP